MATTSPASPPPAPPPPKSRKSLATLGMVWRHAAKYPGHITAAAIALLFAAGATSGVPYAFKLIIDKGFGGGDRKSVV